MPDIVATKDYARQYASLWPELEQEIRRVFFEDKPVLGRTVTQFEGALAAYHRVHHAVGVGSGTDALALALRALGVGPGDEVLTPAYTFAGVLLAILHVGARPVLIDANPATMSMETSVLKDRLTPFTKAVLAVHMQGLPVDITATKRFVDEHQLFLVEDLAQAQGATFEDAPVGSFAHIAAMSFHPSKNLGAFGDGGAILTPDRNIADRIRQLRNLGKADKYRFEELGHNSKLDTLQSAILNVKLRHLDRFVARRRDLARRYREGLSGVGDLLLPVEPAGRRHAYHLYVARTQYRDELGAFLKERGVQSGRHYPIAAHHQPALAPYFVGESFPQAEAIATKGISLPLSHEHHDAEIDAVVRHVRAFFTDRGLS